MYAHGNEESLIKAARQDKLDCLESVSTLKKAKKDQRLQDWEEKTLHGQYLRQTKEDLKKDTKSLIVAAQNQSIRTNLVKAKTDKSQKDTLCGLHKKADECIEIMLLKAVGNLQRSSIKEGIIPSVR